MKKKNGFVFIETIITIVFLASALMLLFSSYQNAISDEKERIYKDDIGYLYRNYYVAEFLINKTNITKILEDEFTNNNYTLNIKKIIDDENNDIEFFSTFQKEQGYPDELQAIINSFNVNNLVVVSDKIITECYNDENKCKKSYEGLDEEFANYIKTMKLVNDNEGKDEVITEYYLVVEYREKDTTEGIKKCNENEENCASFYANLKLDITPKTSKENHLDELCIGQRLGKCITDNYDIENNDESGIYHHDDTLEDGAHDDSYRYAGKNPNNYICFGTNEEKCPNENLYRIIGVFNNKLKIIQVEGTNKNWTQINVLDGVIPDDWVNLVEENEWKIKGFNLNGTAKEIYDAEVKNATDKNPSKSGLMYVSDYMYGASPRYWSYKSDKYNEASASNWLYQKEEWTISPALGTSNRYEVKAGGAIGQIAPKSMQIRGCMYLKDTVILKSGNGTRENPYRISDTGIVIKDVKSEVGYYDVKTIVEAKTSDGKIVKYFYSIFKNGTWSDWEESKENTFTFIGLDADTEYQIKVKALNSRGNYSEEKVINVKTNIYIPPTIKFASKSSTSSSITVSVSSEKGSGEIKEYRFYIAGSLKSTQIETAYTFSNLSANRGYDIKVEVVDESDKVVYVSENIKTQWLESYATCRKMNSPTWDYRLCYNGIWGSTKGVNGYNDTNKIVINYGFYYRLQLVENGWYYMYDKWGDKRSDKWYIECYIRADGIARYDTKSSC